MKRLTSPPLALSAPKLKVEQANESVERRF